MRRDTIRCKNIIIIINVATVFFAIFPIIYSMTFKEEKADILMHTATVIIICLEIISLLLDRIHKAKVDRDILGKKQKDILREIKPSSQNELERAREELRAGIMIMMILAVVVLIIFFFTKKLAWNLAIAMGLVLVIGFIYADYIPHVNRYLKEYDAYFGDYTLSKVGRGMARIYFDEWCNSNLKRNASYYKEINAKDVYETEDEENKVKDYIRSVLGIRADMTDSFLEILGFSMLAVNVMTATSRLFELVASLFSTEMGQYVLNIMSIIAPVIFMIVAICQIYEYYNECYMLHEIWEVIREDDCNHMVELYKKVLGGTKGKLCKIRGAFVYTQKCIEESHDISNVPMKYRMMFPHRYYANKVRYKFTYWLVIAIIMLVLLEFKNISTIVWGIYAVSAGVLYPIGLYLFLPELNRRRVQRECKNMNKETTKKE